MARSRGAAGEGVVSNGPGDGPAPHVLDGFPFGPGKPYAGEPLVCREDDTAVPVVPGGGLVPAKHRELDAVDGLGLLQGGSHGHGREDIDFDQRLAALVGDAQRTVASSLVGEIGEPGVVEAMGAFGPTVPSEHLYEFLPGAGEFRFHPHPSDAITDILGEERHAVIGPGSNSRPLRPLPISFPGIMGSVRTTPISRGPEISHGHASWKGRQERPGSAVLAEAQPSDRLVVS